MHASLLQRDCDLLPCFHESHFSNNLKQKPTSSKSWSQMAFLNTLYLQACFVLFFPQARITSGILTLPCLTYLQQGAFVYKRTKKKLPISLYSHSCQQTYLITSLHLPLLKDSEELIKCCRSVRSKEGVSFVMYNFKYLKFDFAGLNFLSHVLLAISE